ncbi:hypothetical protein F4561_004649 [Lipingzhangella halophila]|uniref:DUF3068 domain-containing protein n=1 Tax=Lipingzhangella halophila TaxID=1783352 RepID=A0A7W7RKU4_9ACTN|nr:DUF3068 domain-containing protein [Lipingzhangella halophila]MBB4933829.1 hypothetical protein [Lipingzhangella halophila]
MRRTIAVVCIALGVFSISLAPMLRFWVADAVMKTPMDYYDQKVNRGENVTYFSIEDVELVEGATVEATTTLRSDVAASGDDTVVWDQFTWVEDVDTGYGITSTARRAAHDRVSGESVDCCDPSVNDEMVHQEGQAFKFPFMTEQKDYEFFDTTVQETHPIRFDGEETIDGMETYRFVQEIDPTKIGERDLPRDLVGMDGEGDVTADEMYSVTRTYWIEPTTGTPIHLSEEQRRVGQVDGEEVLVFFEGDMVWTDETVDSNIESTQDSLASLNLIRGTVPLLLVVAGVGFLAPGVLLLVLAGQGRRARQ